MIHENYTSDPRQTQKVKKKKKHCRHFMGRKMMFKFRACSNLLHTGLFPSLHPFLSLLLHGNIPQVLKCIGEVMVMFLVLLYFFAFC